MVSHLLPVLIRIFDMGRTTVNITGDAACTMVVSNLEAKKEARKAKIK